MARQDDIIDLLGRSLDEAGRAVGGVGAEQLDLPTPCSSWDVRTLVNHVLYDTQQFAAMARGERWQPGSIDVPYEEWVPVFEKDSAGLLTAWQSAAADEAARARLPQTIAEFVIHGWDIARATSQDIAFDDGAAETALNWATGMLKPEFRGSEDSGKSFGPEVSVPADAPVMDRLAGFFGRDPSWTAPG